MRFIAILFLEVEFCKKASYIVGKKKFSGKKKYINRLHKYIDTTIVQFATQDESR